MDRKLIDKLMHAILTASVLLIIAGALFKVQHWPHGAAIQRAGVVFCLIFGGIEIRRLRRVVKELEEGDAESR